jgi:hypothetical protein
MSKGWDLLSPQQQEAARAAARLLEVQDMNFLMLLFGKDERGAILANIEPADAVRLIEMALSAAKSVVEVTEISTEERLH